MQKYAIIVAGGSGTRMQSELPKQFLQLAHQPILMHTIRAFNYDNIKITLVLPENQIEHWKSLVSQFKFQIPHQIVAGGKTRFFSVKNGLDSIPQNEGTVAIHDGVRPLVTREIIDNSFQVASDQGNAIVSIKLKDSIRSVLTIGNQQEDRSKYRLIQTPQTFQLSLIKKAFEQPFDPLFTDDASVLEKAGHSIQLIDGSYRNIKITTPEDLLIAESFLQV